MLHDSMEGGCCMDDEHLAPLTRGCMLNRAMEDNVSHGKHMTGSLVFSRETLPSH